MSDTIPTPRTDACFDRADTKIGRNEPLRRLAEVEELTEEAQKMERELAAKEHQIDFLKDWGVIAENALRDELAAKDAELTQLKTILADPYAVRINMQRGTIAWTEKDLESVMGKSFAERDNTIKALESEKSEMTEKHSIGDKIADEFIREMSEQLLAKNATIDRLRAALNEISRQRPNRYESTVGVVCNIADQALADTGKI